MASELFSQIGARVPFALVPLLGACALPLLPRPWRAPASVLIPAAALIAWLAGWPRVDVTWDYAGYRLVVQHVDGLSIPFVLVFTLTLLIGGLYAYHVRDTAEQVAALLYGGSAIATVLAGDWLTLYVFWEIMAWSSLYLIWAAGTSASGGAGQRYVLVHLFGGSLLLAGIWLHVQQSGTLLLTPLTPGSAASWLILLGFTLNAAVPPLHAWLPDAYPRATVTGSVFLSAFTTKTAVYALARVFAGWEVLVWAGVVMALYGVVFAVIENDMRRLLAYHIVSQVGYMVAGIGLGTELGVSGAAAHAFAHVLYKALLFMGVGCVIYAVGSGSLHELGGLARPLRWALVLYMVGAVSISGFPLFSGFVSKSLVVAALDASPWPILALLMQLAAIGTFLSTGLKLPYFAWFGRSGNRAANVRRPVPPTMYAAMGLAATLSLLIGLFPQRFYRVLPYPVHYEPYTVAHLSETVQMLLFTTVAFALLLPRLAVKARLTLDTDWFYRRLTAWLTVQLVHPITELVARSDRAIERSIDAVVRFAESPTFRQSADVNVSVSAVLLGFLLLALWVFSAVT